jgi:hypothetical protein
VIAETVLAHQGGWDEAFFVAIPLIVFAGLLLLAKRRAEKMAQDPGRVAPEHEQSDPADEP